MMGRESADIDDLGIADRSVSPRHLALVIVVGERDVQISIDEAGPVRPDEVNSPGRRIERVGEILDGAVHAAELHRDAGRY